MRGVPLDQPYQGLLPAATLCGPRAVSQALIIRTRGTWKSSLTSSALLDAPVVSFVRAWRLYQAAEEHRAWTH